MLRQVAVQIQRQSSRSLVKNGRASALCRGLQHSALRWEAVKSESVKTDAKDVTIKPEQDSIDDDRPGAVGGFVRGLFGGRDVAAEDEFKAEAKKSGIEIPDPPPSRRKELQVVKVKRRKEDDEENQGIRDRLFSRFAGSSFIRGAMDARERIYERIDESDNPVINFFRDMHARLFSETEMGSVLRAIRESDPNFRIYDFIREMESNYIPTVLGAYLSSDLETLKEQCTEEAYEVLVASVKEQAKEGVKIDPTILDISDVELTSAKFLGEDPVVLVSFSAQQINCVRNKKGDIVEGKVDDIRAVYYIWAVVQEDGENEAEPQPTGGSSNESSDEEAEDSKEEKKEPPNWKMLEMVIRGAHSTI